MRLVFAREPCVHRDYGNGATTCVCTATHCDDLEPIKKTAKGVITLFETSKKGDRFKETSLKFGDSHSEHVTKTQTITIDKSKKLQKIIGFGGAFTGSYLSHTIFFYFSIQSNAWTSSQIPSEWLSHLSLQNFRTTSLKTFSLIKGLSIQSAEFLSLAVISRQNRTLMPIKSKMISS